MYLLKLIKAQEVHFCILLIKSTYVRIITLLTFFRLKQSISKKSNMILKSLIYTDWKRFPIIMT